MDIALFFTYDYTLSLWNKSGTLNKELKIYQNLAKKHGISFTIFTYGDDSEFSFKDSLDGIKLIPIYSLTKMYKNKMVRFIASFLIPFKIKKYLSKNTIIQQHQLLGIWVTLILKLITGNPLYLRTGYDMYEFSIKEKKPFVLKYFFKLLTALSLKYADIYSVASSSDYTFLKNNFNLLNKNVVIRSNWVDSRDLRDSTRVKNRILSVGRLEDQKNYNLLFKELANTSEALTVDIIGSGTKETELEDLAKEQNVKVNFMGSIENKELLSLYEKYYFFISTSKFEGNPKTILEAMASGCVVIASDISNHKELIDHRINGILFDLDNPDLLNIITEVSKDKKLIDEISRKAVNKVQELNSLDFISEKYFLDYKSLI